MRVLKRVIIRNVEYNPGDELPELDPDLVVRLKAAKYIGKSKGRPRRPNGKGGKPETATDGPSENAATRPAGPAE